MDLGRENGVGDVGGLGGFEAGVKGAEGGEYVDHRVTNLKMIGEGWK